MAEDITMDTGAGVNMAEDGDTEGIITILDVVALEVASARVFILGTFACEDCLFRLRNKIFSNSSLNTILWKTASYLHTGVMGVQLGKVT